MISRPPGPGSMSSSIIEVPRIDTAKELCSSSIQSCPILLSSESTLPSTRSATWTLDSTHGATHSGTDKNQEMHRLVLRKYPSTMSTFPHHDFIKQHEEILYNHAPLWLTPSWNISPMFPTPLEIVFRSPP